MSVTGQITAETIVNWISHLGRLTIERDELAVDRDRYKEAFAQLVNEVGEHVTWLRRWETDPDMSPHRAAAELESVIDDIMREERIDDDE